jgi:hypothetical protein
MNPAPDIGFGSNLQEEGEALLPESALHGGVVSMPPEGPKATPNVLNRYKKRLWIELQDNDQIPPTGLFIGHNGTGFMLKAGVEAEVPLELLDILNNAVYDAPIVDTATKQIIGYTPRLRFPYRVVNNPKARQQAA